MVTNNADTGAGSLRNAIDQANVDPGLDRIEFSSAVAGSTITLGSQLVINSDVIIDGGGQAVVISGGNTTRHFTNSEGNTLGIISLRLTAGSSIASGGAVNHLGSDLLIQDSTIDGNVAAVRGGAIYIDDGSGGVTIHNSTISGNTATDNGGGVQHQGNGVLQIVNTTIAGNRSDSDANGRGYGGGISTRDGSVTITRNSIVAGNFMGTGTRSHDINGQVDVNSSGSNVIGDAGTSGGIQDGINPSTGLSNTVGNSGSGTLDTTTILDPSFTNNGGPYPTHALVSGSPAIDSGRSTFAVYRDGTTPIVNDVRQAPFRRDYDGNINNRSLPDAGSVEYYGALEVTTTDDTVDDNHTVGAFSLREALEIANAQPGHDRIVFDPLMSGLTITVGSRLEIASSLTIAGLGASSTTIDGDAASLVFRIHDESADLSDVEISDLTITNGSSTGPSGINNHENLTLNNVWVRNNFSSGAGAGLLHQNGSLEVSNSTFSGNSGRLGSSYHTSPKTRVFCRLAPRSFRGTGVLFA